MHKAFRLHGFSILSYFLDFGLSMRFMKFSLKVGWNIKWNFHSIKFHEIFHFYFRPCELDERRRFEVVETYDAILQPMSCNWRAQVAGRWRWSLSNEAWRFLQNPITWWRRHHGRTQCLEVGWVAQISDLIIYAPIIVNVITTICDPPDQNESHVSKLQSC